MELLSENLELRGVKNVKGKNEKTYYILLCELTKSGEPVQFYCPDASALPTGLKKGDYIYLTLEYNFRFKNLIVKKVEIAK